MMNWKRIMACALVLTVALGTMTPAFAQEPLAQSPAIPHGIVLPMAEELPDEELAQIRGKVVPWVVGGVVAAVTFAVSNWDEEKDADWYARGLAATALGAVTAGVGAGLAGAATTTAGKIAAGVYTGTKGVILEYVLGQDPSE